MSSSQPIIWCAKRELTELFSQKRTEFAPKLCNGDDQSQECQMGNFWKRSGKCSQGGSGKSECSGKCSQGCSGKSGVLQGVLPRVLSVERQQEEHSREHSLEHPGIP